MSDAEILYEYAVLGVRCEESGYILSTTRTHIHIRNRQLELVVQEQTVAGAAKALDRLLGNGEGEMSSSPDNTPFE